MLAHDAPNLLSSLCAGPAEAAGSWLHPELYTKKSEEEGENQLSTRGARQTFNIIGF